MEKVCKEVLGKKQIYVWKRGSKLWNETIKEKKRNQLFTDTFRYEPLKDIYKQKYSAMKYSIREAHNKSWNIFNSNIEDDLRGRQMVAYKLIKHQTQDSTSQFDCK